MYCLCNYRLPNNDYLSFFLLSFSELSSADLICLYITEFVKCLVFVEHFVESIIKLSRHSIDLHLLTDNLVLKFINSEMKFADVHLGILSTRVGLFKSDVDLLDLVLVFLLASSCFFFRNLKLLLVFSNSLKLVFNNGNTGF